MFSLYNKLLDLKRSRNTWVLMKRPL